MRTRMSGIGLAVALAARAWAAVLVVTVEERSPALDGYEREKGTVRFAVDPEAAANRGIVDLALAPKDAQGKVEFSANFYVLKPAGPAKSNGTALVEVSNRGGKALLQTFDFAKGSADPRTKDEFGDEFLLKRGFTLVWIGWEFDVPDTAGMMRLNAPVATQNGKTITGLVRAEWTGDKEVKTIPLGDRSQIGYPVADEGDAANRMYVRDRVDGPRTEIVRGAWSFSGTRHVTMEAGFQPGRIYEIVYRAKDPVVAGLGFAAVRDFVSYLKTGGAGVVEKGAVKRAIGFGISQDGRFLRTYLQQGFNTGEDGRKVFDGIWAHVGGAGQGSFNARFAQPSRDGHPFLNVLYPVDVPPFTPEELLEKERAAGTAPKLFLSNGAYEYWGRCASLIHTSRDGKKDVPPGEGTRIYFFAGAQHGPGSMPPREVAGAANRTSANDYRPGMRALLAAMEAWLETGAEPPASRYPSIAAGEAVSLAEWKFPSIPGVEKPERKREAYRLDFGGEPPKIGAPYPTLVPQVDEDGNDRSGIRLPEIAAPLATNTGWNLRTPAIGGQGELYSMAGSWIPFARTKADRERTGDPRKSVEERYRSREDYLGKVQSAAASLVRDGYLLEEDVAMVKERAGREWDLIEGAK